MTQPKRKKDERAELVKLFRTMVPGDFVKVLDMGSQLFFQIVSPFFQIGSFVGLRYHDFFKCVSRLLQIT